MEADLKRIEDTRADAEHYRDAFSDLLKNWDTLSTLNTERAKAGDEALKLAEQTAELGMEDATKVTKSAASALIAASMTMMAGLGIAVVVAVILGVFFTHGITGPISRIITSLTSNSEQVNAAASQVA